MCDWTGTIFVNWEPISTTMRACTEGLWSKSWRSKDYLVWHTLAADWWSVQILYMSSSPLPSSQILHCTGRSVFLHKHKMKHCLWCNHSQSVLCCCKRSLKNNHSVVCKGRYRFYQIPSWTNAGTNLNKEENCSSSQISDMWLVCCVHSNYHKRKPVHHPPGMGIDKCVLREVCFWELNKFLQKCCKWTVQERTGQLVERYPEHPSFKTVAHYTDCSIMFLRTGSEVQSGVLRFLTVFATQGRPQWAFTLQSQLLQLGS